jgi:hypothetical protein
MVAPFVLNPTLKTRRIPQLCMTNRKEITSSRQVKCSACGAAFGCNPEGPCWCAEETVRLPMPEEGADCLCPTCLRKAAAAAREQTLSPN